MKNKRLLSLGSDKKHAVTRIQKRTKGVSWSVAIGRYCGRVEGICGNGKLESGFGKTKKGRDETLCRHVLGVGRTLRN